MPLVLTSYGIVFSAMALTWGLGFALNLIVVTATDGKPLFLNPEEIVTLRHPPPGDHHANAECIIYTADGKFLAIREYCETVERLLGERR